MASRSKILTKADKKAEKDKIRLVKLQTLFAKKRQDMLNSRLESLDMGRANKFCCLGDEFQVRYEMLHGHYDNLKDKTSGRTVLCEAIASGHYDIVRTLIIEFRVDPNYPTLLGGQLPLQLACFYGYRQMASLLITHGADVNGRDKRGRTALHMVRSMTLAKLLFKYPIDAAAKTYDEFLTPPAYYKKYVIEEEQNLELYNWLCEKEVKAEIEQNKAKLRDIRSRKDQHLKLLDVVTDATIAD